jgi:predicted DNA-binding transcriptional regulator YafY
MNKSAKTVIGTVKERHEMSLTHYSTIEGINMSKHKEWEPKEFARYWLLLESIENAPRYKTVEELQRILDEGGYGVNKRTVQRIVGFFSKRFGLKSRERADERGRPFEWAWSKTEGRPVVGVMDPPTALTYELAAQLLAPLLPSTFLDGMERDFRRARKVLGQVNKKARSLTNKIRILPRGRGRLPAQVDQTVLNELYNALFANTQVEVRYLAQSNTSQQPKSYVLNPLAIVFRFDTLYLIHVAQPNNPDQDPDTVMEWPIHRVKRVTTLDKLVRRPPGFDLNEHLRYPGFLRNNFLEKLRDAGPTLRLKALFPAATARYVQERPFSMDQKITKTRDGRVRVEATVANTRELLTELHDFSSDVEVLAPKVLRNYFQDLSRKLYAQYSEKAD